MATCPEPDVTEVLVYPSESVCSAPPPDNEDESCNTPNSNTTNTPQTGPPVTIETTTPVAGPPGPTGPAASTQVIEDVICDTLAGGDEGQVLTKDSTSTNPCDVEWKDSEGLTAEEKEAIDDIIDEVGDTPEEQEELEEDQEWMDEGEETGTEPGVDDDYTETEIIDEINESFVGDGLAGSLFNGPLSYINVADATLPRIIDEICSIFSFVPDTSLLANEPISFRVLNQTPRRNILEQLSLIYGFSMVASGNTLHFIPWDTPSVKTITLDDMGYGMSDNEVSRYNVERIGGVDLPRRVELTYNDRDISYQDSIAAYEVIGYDEGVVLSVIIPFIITFEEAQKIAERILELAHLEATKFTYNLSFAEHMELEPGDTIETPIGKHRIESIRVTNDGIMELSAVDASFIGEMSIPSGAGIETLPTDQNPASVVGYSNAIILDLPPLNSNDKELRLCAGLHGYGTSNWPGATIYESLDGVTYNQIARTAKSVTFGKVTTPLINPPAFRIFDDVNTIIVELKTGTLQNATDNELYIGEVNHAMIGKEMIAFGSATLITEINGIKTYHLTHILRGLQGTEYWIGKHLNTELFVLIDDSLIKLPYSVDERGHERLYKIVTDGSSEAKGNTQRVVPGGTNLVPWLVGNRKCINLGASTDWLITWDERSRFSADELQDYQDSKHDFDFGGWVVTILDPNDETIRKGIYHTYKPNFTYSTAKQINDFGSVQTCLSIKVYALSTIVGGGYSEVFYCT
jgi:hypothetical protein